MSTFSHYGSHVQADGAFDVQVGASTAGGVDPRDSSTSSAFRSLATDDRKRAKWRQAFQEGFKRGRRDGMGIPDAALHDRATSGRDAG